MREEGLLINGVTSCFVTFGSCDLKRMYVYIKSRFTTGHEYKLAFIQDSLL